MNSKIILGLIGIGIVIIMLIVGSSFMKPYHTQSGDQYITKGNISPLMSNSTLPENYTSLQLLDYCSQNESQIHNDNCIRGMWNVKDQCQNSNFSSTNSVCNDPRLEQFELKVDKEMDNLSNSLTKVIDSCMNATLNSVIQQCVFTIDRIKNDCSDSHFYSLTHICADPRLDKFVSKHHDIANIG